MRVEEFAPAKINLALHVAPAQADGRHPLWSVAAFSAAVGDRLIAEEDDGLSLRVSGPFAAGLSLGEDNYVLRAARALAGACGVTAGARLSLDKRLPLASGLGGGTADGAAALRALNVLWGLGLSLDRLGEIARVLGADGPACLLGRSLIMTGTGEDVARIDLPRLPVVLVNPKQEATTAAVYRAFDALGAPGALAPRPTRFGENRAEALSLLAGLRNDLTDAAMRVAPGVGDALTALAQTRPALVRLSGSGATCFALYTFEEQASAACAALRARHGAWWIAQDWCGDVG